MAASTGAVYTGLAPGSIGSNNFLYAADGAGAGSITVYNNFFQVVGVPGTFTDPSLPSGLVPFNVVNINGTLFVTYDNPNNEQLAAMVAKFTTQRPFLAHFTACTHLFS